MLLKDFGHKVTTKKLRMPEACSTDSNTFKQEIGQGDDGDLACSVPSPVIPQERHRDTTQVGHLIAHRSSMLKVVSSCASFATRNLPREITHIFQSISRGEGGLCVLDNSTKFLLPNFIYSSF